MYSQVAAVLEFHIIWNSTRSIQFSTSLFIDVVYVTSNVSFESILIPSNFWHLLFFICAIPIFTSTLYCELSITSGPPPKERLGGLYSPHFFGKQKKKKKITQLKIKMNKKNANLVSIKFFFFLFPTNRSKNIVVLNCKLSARVFFIHWIRIQLTIEFELNV